MEKLNLALDHLCQNFGGEWLLVGGSLIRFNVDPNRGTEDIDIVYLGNESTSQKTRLILEMKTLGISPEQLNSSAFFFLNQIPNWQQHITPLIAGKKGKIFRPTLTLFSILKFKRGTEVDVEDVRAASQKWGTSEFDKNVFVGWASDRELSFAKSLGLLA